MQCAIVGWSGGLVGGVTWIAASGVEGWRDRREGRPSLRWRLRYLRNRRRRRRLILGRGLVRVVGVLVLWRGWDLILWLRRSRVDGSLGAA